jgi:hypothetical protein
MGEFRC